LRSPTRSTLPEIVDNIMETFEVYIDDERYGVPSLYLITAASEVEAREAALALWRESGRHRGVELRRDGQPLFAAGTLAPGARSQRGPSPESP
jgi:hypothetical protein